MILTETKISNKAYYHNRLSYNVVCSMEATMTYGVCASGIGSGNMRDNKGLERGVNKFSTG